MSRKCKCKVCKKILTTDIAFKVEGNNYKTKYHGYYCNENEINTKIAEDEEKEQKITSIYSIINYALGEGEFTFSLIAKVFREIINTYNHADLVEYLTDNKDYLYDTLYTKTFQSSFGKANYLKRIIETGMVRYNDSKPIEEYSTRRIYDMIFIENPTYKTSKVRKGIEDKIADLLEEEDYE